MNAGADIVELDVRRTADGELVVIHDATIVSESPGTAAVAALTLAQIGRLHPETPVLDDVLEQLRGRVALEVEIKNDANEAGYEPSGTTIARDVVAALRRHAFTDAFIASFDADCLRSVQDVDHQIQTGLLLDAPDPLDAALEIAVARNHAFLLPEASALESAGRRFIDRARKHAVRICTWTVDDPLAIERLFALGADAVETNDPSVGVAVRDRVRRRV